MRKVVNKVVALAVAAALFFLGSGCSNSSATPGIEALQDCGLAGLLALLSSVERIGDVLDEIEGDDQPGVTVTPTMTANEFDFVLTLDLDGDRVSETTISGRLTFANDPTDGIENGDTAMLTLNQPSGTQVSSVGATLEVTFLGSGVSLEGSAAVNGILGCNVSYTFPQSDPLVVNFNEAPVIEAQRRLAVDFARILAVSGTAEMNITTTAVTLMSTVIFSGTSQTISFTNNMLGSTELDDSNVEGPLGEAEFERLQLCVIEQVFAINAIGAIIETIQNAVADGRTGTTAEGDSFTFTNVSGNTYDLSISGLDANIDIMVTARATFDSDPTVQNFTGRADVSSWTYTARVASMQLAGFNPGDILFNSVDGVSTGPMRVTFVNGDEASVSGRGRFTRLDGSCTANVNIPVTNPLVLDETIMDPSPGRIEIDMALDGLPFVATFVFDMETILDEALITGARYDGIPIPGNLLRSIFDFSFGD